MTTTARTRAEPTDWRPWVCFFLLGVAQLGVFWFSAYRILTATFVGLSLMLLVWGPARGIPSFDGRRALWSFLAVYAYMALSTLWAPTTGNALLEFGMACIVAAPPLMLGWLLGRRSTLDAIGAGMLVFPLLLFLQAFYSLRTVGDAMRVGDFNIRTIVAGLVCMTAPILLARALAMRSAMTFLGVALSLAIVVVNESRSSALIVAPALLYVVKGYSSSFFRLTSVLMVTVILAGAMVFTAGGSVGRFSAEGSNFELYGALIDELAEGSTEEVDLERRVHAVIASALFVNNPVFGAGYSSVLQSFIAELNLEVMAHGFVPGMLGELGVVGMALIAVFAWRTVRALRTDTAVLAPQHRFIRRGFVAGFGALLAYGVFHQIFEWAYFPMLVGLMLGATTHARTAQTSMTPAR